MTYSDLLKEKRLNLFHGLSYSSLAAFRRCRYAYHLQYELGLSATPKSHLVYGSALHEIFAFLLKSICNKMKLNETSFRSDLLISELVTKGQEHFSSKWSTVKSKEVTDYQRELAVKEDEILINKIKSENIEIANIDEECLEDFKSVTSNFHESYFQTYPHMKKYIKT